MAENGEAPSPGVPHILPEIVQGILLCLPAADVHRCRFVCKEWRGLVSDKSFIRTYRQRHPPMPLFFYLRDYYRGARDPTLNPGIARVDLQAVDLAARESRLVLRFHDVPDAVIADYGMYDLNPGVDPRFPNRVFAVEGSCDGILLLSYYYQLEAEERLYACNPCTRHWARLPRNPPQANIIAFYRRSPPGEGRDYRIMYQTIQWRGEDFHVTYQIRVLRQQALHQIDGPADLVLYSAQVAAPTMLPGSVHWMFTSQQACHLLVFDTAAERFRWISPLPAPAEQIVPWFRPSPYTMLEMGGMLAMAVFDQTRTNVHVWVLRGYVTGAWVYSCVIRLPIDAINANNGYQHLHIVSPEPEVLVRCPYALLQSDADGSVLQHYRRPHHWTIDTPYMLEESFELHPFLLAQGNDAEPPFFLFQ